MRLVSRKLLLFILTGVTIWTFGEKVKAAGSVSFKNQGDTLSLELTGQTDWSYDLKRKIEKNQTKVLLVVNGLDEQLYERLKNTKNSLIKSIQVKADGPDGKKQIEFTLSSSKVETFDYLTDHPSKLIIDFYFNEPEKTTQAAAAPAPQKAKPQVGRAPANTDFFEVTPIGLNTKPVNLKESLFTNNEARLARFKFDAHEVKPKQDAYEVYDYYFSYPIMDRTFVFWNRMKENQPAYEILPEKSEENKHVRLIKKLFDKNRTHVLQQTTDWFSSKYPKSKYLELAYAMTADSLIGLWEKEKKNEYYDLAQLYYNKLTEFYPDSPLAERTSLAVGMYELDKKNYLAAMRKLKYHSENKKYENKNSNYYAQLGLSYALAKLNKIDEAIQIVESVENSTKEAFIKAEASFRKGDYYVMAEKYQSAKNQYLKAEKDFPQYTHLYPSALFNKMEAYFHLKMSHQSHEAALDFIQRFPQDDFAPYALTRLGELIELIGAPQEKAVGAYLETQFRYGDNPKTVVARLHLMSTRMKGMKDVELKQTIDKMNELADKSDLDNIQQFKTVMISDGLSRRKEFDKAIQVLVKYHQDYPNMKNPDRMANRVRSNIHSYIRDLSEIGKNKEVLKVYQQYADNWLRKQEGFDTYYYLGKAYQAAGAYDEALKKYDISEKMLASRSPASEENSGLPPKETISLGRALSLFEKNQLKEAELALDKIKNPDVLSPEEQIARVNLASQLHEKNGEYETATRYLSEVVRVWKEKPNLVTDSAVRLAMLLNKAGKAEQGIQVLDQFLNEKITAANTKKIYKAKGEIAINAKLTKEAIEALSYIIEKGSGENLAKEKYQLGDLYFQKGELKKAENVWSSFADKDDQFWSKLANEKMQSAKWQDEYKKYLKRIPATVGVE